ncbi:DUF2637 domain-containing protein, partial [Streptomyces sp. NPDC057910]|uniref:DUF2637 domain-containing protein n=1 Tax=Streptomyces sp. NPDC057910 TaxID=3346278 RepID=UPI0036EEC7AC
MKQLLLTRTHRILIGVVAAGAVVIAGIGFAGSYAAVRELALRKGFGNFAYVFPVGIDAGICVLLALFPVTFLCSAPHRQYLQTTNVFR